MSAHKGGRGRGRGGGHEEEHENSERWLVSYSDMITVLMALFIVLFAISEVNQTKFLALRSSLSAGFQDGASQQSVLDGSSGTMDGESMSSQQNISTSTDASLVQADQGLGSEGTNPTAMPAATANPTVAAAQAELAKMDALEKQMQAALTAQGLADQVTYRVTSRGLVVGMVASDVYFAPESAALTAAANRLVDALSGALKSSGRDISIEGHANTIPTSGVYASNWELSADRATKVLRRLVESDGLIATKIEAVGFGDARPLAPGTDDTAMQKNRRVDIVILSDAPDAVRALLPTLAGSAGAGS